MKLRLGTRGSALALWQARWVAERLGRAHPGLEVEERILRTEGDQRTDQFGSGDNGVFVHRIEQALLDNEVDLAVHSLKDLPTAQPVGLLIAAVPPRHDARDALLSIRDFNLAGLPQGARVATGSPRRRSQLLHARPDLELLPLRGNVDTRVGRVVAGDFDAVVLALAGVQRLGIDSVDVRPIDPASCLPAVGQGALALEAREEDSTTRELVSVMEHPETRVAIEAERAFLARLQGGCLAPASAHGQVVHGRLQVEAVVAELDGTTVLREHDEDALTEALALGTRLADRMLAAGAGGILERARA